MAYHNIEHCNGLEDVLIRFGRIYHGGGISKRPQVSDMDARSTLVSMFGTYGQGT